MNEAEIKIARQYPDCAAGDRYLSRNLQPALTRTMLENEFERIVATAARVYYGWPLVFHVRAAIKIDGQYVTPVSYDGEGYPDLEMLRPSTVTRVVQELKVKKNKPTEKQLDWLEAFQQCGVPAFVWYPSDVEEIKTVLRHGFLAGSPLGTDLSRWGRGWKRTDREGRDVTNLPGLWDDSDSITTAKDQ